MKFILSLLILSSLLFAAVNINTATKEELMSVKGIGEAKAEAILEYRSKKPFESVEELEKVKGFGKKNLEKIKDELSVSDN